MNDDKDMGFEKVKVNEFPYLGVILSVKND